MRVFLAWFIALCVQIAGLGIAYHYELQTVIFHSDPTFLTFGIIIYQFIVMLLLGWQILKYERNDDLKSLDLENYWFAADDYVNFGMIGTVVGFIMSQTQFLQASGLSKLINDPSSVNFDTIKNALQANLPIMLFGMFTALWATLAGLVSASFLKKIVRYVEHRQEKQTEEIDNDVILDF
jgi:hypothetical protein